jgi:FemAB-related protein (PEP-CTERM system-associated)
MGIRLFRKEDTERWDRYVEESATSNCYHLIGWKNVIEETFGHKTYYLLSEGERSEINGILPLVHLKSIPFGSFMVSLPYFNYGGICADSNGARDQLLKEAIDIAWGKKAEHIELRHKEALEIGLPAKTSKVCMRLGLPQKAEDLWESFTSNLRRKIRRPVKEGIFVKFGGGKELDNFYRVFSINMRDLGTPVYPKKFFANILNSFNDRTWICTVFTKENKAVASGFLVGFKDQLEIPWVSSLRSHNRYYTNMFLYWHVLKFACENHYRFFDFGRSTPGEGTYKFKEQWGAKPVQLYWHYWLRKGGLLPELNPKNPKYRLAIKVWQTLPVGFTRLLGPLIVKNLP